MSQSVSCELQHFGPWRDDDCKRPEAPLCSEKALSTWWWVGASSWLIFSAVSWFPYLKCRIGIGISRIKSPQSRWIFFVSLWHLESGMAQTFKGVELWSAASPPLPSPPWGTSSASEAQVSPSRWLVFTSAACLPLFPWPCSQLEEVMKGGIAKGATSLKTEFCVTFCSSFLPGLASYLLYNQRSLSGEQKSQAFLSLKCQQLYVPSI